MVLMISSGYFPTLFSYKMTPLVSLASYPPRLSHSTSAPLNKSLQTSFLLLTDWSTYSTNPQPANRPPHSSSDTPDNDLRTPPGAGRPCGGGRWPSHYAIRFLKQFNARRRRQPVGGGRWPKNYTIRSIRTLFFCFCGLVEHHH